MRSWRRMKHGASARPGMRPPGQDCWMRAAGNLAIIHYQAGNSPRFSRRDCPKRGSPAEWVRERLAPREWGALRVLAPDTGSPLGSPAQPSRAHPVILLPGLGGSRERRTGLRPAPPDAEGLQGRSAKSGSPRRFPCNRGNAGRVRRSGSIPTGE